MCYIISHTFSRHRQVVIKSTNLISFDHEWITWKSCDNQRPYEVRSCRTPVWNQLLCVFHDCTMQAQKLVWIVGWRRSWVKGGLGAWESSSSAPVGLISHTSYSVGITLHLKGRWKWSLRKHRVWAMLVTPCSFPARSTPSPFTLAWRTHQSNVIFMLS